MVVEPDQPESAMFHTGLAATYSAGLKTEFLYYIMVTGKINVVQIVIGEDTNITVGTPRYCDPGQSAPLQGTSLAATTLDGATSGAVVRVYYQTIKGELNFLESHLEG